MEYGESMFFPTKLQIIMHALYWFNKEMHVQDQIYKGIKKN